MKEPLVKDQDKFVLRLPDGMRDRLKRLASENGRSLNAQIIHMLEYAIDDMDVSAHVYGNPDKALTTAVFLRTEIRKAQSILQSILADVEDPESPLNKHAPEDNG